MRILEQLTTSVDTPLGLSGRQFMRRFSTVFLDFAALMNGMSSSADETLVVRILEQLTTSVDTPLGLSGRQFIRRFATVFLDFAGLMNGMSSSADNRRVLVAGLAPTASRRALESKVTGQPERGSSSRLVSPSLNLFNQFSVVQFEMIPSPSTSRTSIFFAASVV
jgi:hypothetical protein